MGEGKAALGAAQMVATLAEWKGVATEADQVAVAVSGRKPIHNQQSSKSRREPCN